MTKKLFILLLVTANFGCDQLSKYIVRKEISSDEIISVIGRHVVLTRVENAGAFLSTGESLNDSLKFTVLALLPLLLLCFGISYLMHKKDLPKLFVLGMSFVIGGGLGNLYDRFLYGAVTDFMYIDIYIYQTGIFNFADLSVLIGLITIAAHLYEKNHQRSYPSHQLDI
jgi:signal peptidase II